MEISLRGNTFRLLPSKTILWKEKNVILVSDLHLGKTEYFRSKGIAAPDGSDTGDIDLLKDVVNSTGASGLIIIGDLFHAGTVKDEKLINKFIDSFTGKDIRIIKGNHDKFKREQFKNIRELLIDQLETDDFIFAHKHFQHESKFVFAGHVHPAVYLRGPGKQNERVPCFYFTQDYAILPSFGSFTGTYLIFPTENDRLFVPAEDEVIEIFSFRDRSL